jgi:hypothetical protein
VTRADDYRDEMFGFSLGDGTADALLEGRMQPDDAPPGFQEVAELVLAARSLSANGGLADENSVVAAFVETLRTPVGVPDIADGDGRMFGRMFSAKVAGVAAVLALGGATAAAATGSLPGSVQAALSRNLSHIGINVPDPHTGNLHTGTSTGTGASTSGGAGSNAGLNAGKGRSTALAAPSTTANEYGLCTAYSAPDGRSSPNTTRGSALSSVAFSRLSALAQAQGESVQAFCASIPKPGTSTGTSTGTSAGTSAGSDSTSSTVNGGKPATNPAGKTPGPPATTPAGNTPGGQPASTPPGNTPAGPPAFTPGGNTPGAQSSTPPANGGNSASTPAATHGTASTTDHGKSGSHTGP